MTVEQRMAAKKLKEQEAKKLADQTALQPFPVAIKFSILAKNVEEANESLGMLIKSMQGFDDIVDVTQMNVDGVSSKVFV